MANIIKIKSGDTGDAPASDALVRGELAIRHVAGNHTASSSSKLYFGEGQGSGSVTLRQFGFGITDGSTQSGVAIGENMTFTASGSATVAVSGTTVTIGASSGGVSLANDANNRVVTADGSGGINGEANLTFDGSTLAVTGAQTVSGNLTVSGDIALDGQDDKIILGDSNSYIFQNSENFYIRAHNDMVLNIDTPNDATTRHFIFRSNTSNEIMRMGEDKLVEMQGNLNLDSDAAVLSFGEDQDVTLTHVADTGLTLTHHGTSDDLPLVLKLKSEEDTIAADETIARIDFEAGDDSGNDAILPAASIAAVAEATFSSGDNSTKLTFGLGESVTSVGRTCFTMDHDGDFHLNRDGRSIKFGDSGTQIALTHVDNTGLTLNGNFVPAADDTHDLGTASAAWQDLHIEGNIESTDAMSINSGAGDISFGPAENLTLGSNKRFEFRDDAIYIHSSADGQLDLVADTEIQIAATTIDINGNTEISGTLSVTGDISGGDDLTITDDLILNDNLALNSDESIIQFGSDGEVNLSHIHDTGLLLNSTNKLQFNNSHESIHSDGSKLVLTSNSVAFDMPTADGTSGQFLKTDGSGNLSFATVSSGSGDITGVDLTGGTGITIGSETGTTSGDYSATITNSGVTSIVAGSGISISGATGAVTITNSVSDTTLSTENVQDIAGGMFTGNTETGITATYQDGDGTIDLAVGTLNQDTTGSAATLTNARTIAGVSFDGSANISLNNNAITNGAGYTTNTGTVDTTGTVNANEFAQFNDSNTLQALTAAEMRSALSVDNYSQWNLSAASSTAGVGSGDTVTFAAGTGVDVAKSSNTITYSADVSDFMTNGSNNRVVTATGTDAMNAEANFTFDGTDALIASSGKLQLGDSGTYIHQSADSVIDIVADGHLKTVVNTLKLGRDDGNVTIDFLGGDNDGEITWVHASDRFNIPDNLLLVSDTKLFFRDEQIFIHSDADSSLTIDTNGTIKMKANVDFDDKDLSNIDSLDADKFSIAGGTEMTAINDEDNMASDSATALATQQSIKAYVDSQSGGGGGSPGGSDTQVQFNNGGSFGGDSKFIWDDTKLDITTANSDTVILRLMCTDTDGNHGPVMDFRRDSSSPADGDELGRIRFIGDNSNGSQRAYAAMYSEIVDVTNATDDGRIVFSASIQNSHTDILGIGAHNSTGGQAVFPMSYGVTDLGTSSLAFNDAFILDYKGHNGSGFDSGVTMKDQSNNPTQATFAVTDGGGATVNLTMAVSGGIVALADMQPTGGSDIKYKENIQDYSKGLSFVESLPSSRSWDWKDSASEIKVIGTSSDGYVAQELESAGLSDYVSTIKSSEWNSIDDSVEDYKVVEYVKLEKDILYSLVNSVKELSARVKVLEG